MDASGRRHFLLLLICSLCFFASTATPGTSPMCGRRGFDYLDTLPKSGVYSGRFRSDSVFYGDQLSFISRDTALFFLDDQTLRLQEIPCATYYRVAPLNKYYQQDGLVTDYYLENDSVASRLPYKEGILDGLCVFYYKNGQVREKGSYAKNARTGIWEYYYENGRKAKTVRITDKGAYLIDCFTEKGKILAQGGNGRFDGTVSIGTPANPTELRMSGPVKDGVPDGEWNIYDRFLSHPLMVEHFSSGRFLRGISTSITGTQKYNDRFYSAVESVHPLEALDHYGCDDFCLVAGKDQHLDGTTLKPYAEIGTGIKDILKSGKYRDYSGWILLDIHYDMAGQLSAKSVRLYQENEAFQNELLAMLDRLSRPGRFTLNGKSTPYERFYVVLVEANSVVIPEEILYKRIQALIFGHN